MTDIEIQRERFEAWFRENYPSWVCFERENGKYTSNAVSMTWDGYLACYQANLEAKAVGCCHRRRGSATRDHLSPEEPYGDSSVTPEEQTKLVERLREMALIFPRGVQARMLFQEAAQVIEALQKENARLREGVEKAFREGFYRSSYVKGHEREDEEWLESDVLKSLSSSTVGGEGG